MAKDKIKYFLVMSIFITTLFIIIKIAFQSSKETIIFFPLHKEAQFNSAQTQISFVPGMKQTNYKIDFSIHSELDRNAYLRQDIGLLFRNGKLIKIKGIGDWKQNTSILDQSNLLKDSGSGYYQAISFHYGEIHDNEAISSVQEMSNNYLYVIQSKFSPTFISFRTSRTKDELQWENTINQLIEKQLTEVWKHGMLSLGIDLNQYLSIPITELANYNQRPLPGFTKMQSQEIIGKLWEGLYKNYLLGIKKEDGTSVHPLGSSVPLLLINRNRHELLVLIITKDLEPELLKQSINLLD
ncbi:hypothetical protein ACQKP0_08090 [Heyndrickxia sp. NPDC080065]|uniref:hypothetical protein n=1 Tax=Heyndrickxia sp. NPDC080065 TaxID=3390568 RepID=UPI003D01F1D1